MYKAISLFSGCGGLDLGIKGGFCYLNNYYAVNPIDIIFANDINDKALTTLNHNIPCDNIVHGDITQLLNIETAPNNPPKTFAHADIVIGGFPCQDFSLSGKRQGLSARRGTLYQSMAKVIALAKPRIFLAENVKGLLSSSNGEAIKTIINEFSDIGYNVEYKLLNVVNFGVPQNRERVIIVGTHKSINKPLVWTKPTHSNTDTTLKKIVTIGDAIGDLEDTSALQALPNCDYSKAKLYKGKQGNTITKRDSPSPTIRAEHHGNIEFHYSLPRRLSAREAARIQSFPDNFTFYNSTSDAYRQIGNAVPPVFAWHLAQMLLKFLQ